MASFGMTPPPYDSEVNEQAPSYPPPYPPSTDIGGQMSTMPSTGMQFNSTPNWSDQLAQASSTPPGVEDHIQNELKGVASHMKTSEDGGNKYMGALAPILAGAAAVLGGLSGSDAANAVLGGVAKGYTNHLMTQAKEAADLKHQSDTKTIDLAHKYLAEMPGDVDPQKYPRLAELGEKVREDLVNGKLSNPKDAQEFILHYTHYKNDIEKEREDTLNEQLKNKAKAPYQAFNEALNERGIPPEQAGSAFMHHYGGLAPDPEHPGQYVAPQTITGQYGLKRQVSANEAAGERTNKTVEAANTRSNNTIAARHADVATQESGRNSRSAARLKAKGGTSGKEFDAAYKAAQAHARAIDAKRPMGDPNAMKRDANDYLLNSGHTPTKNVGGKTYYYVGNDQWSAAPPSAAGNAMKTMTPPPSIGEEDDSDYGEEESE